MLPKDDKSVRVTTIPAPASRKIWHENEDSPDIGLELFTQVILLAQCNMLLGSVVSNVDQVTLELMATRQWPPSHLDMYVFKHCTLLLPFADPVFPPTCPVESQQECDLLWKVRRRVQAVLSS